MSKKAQGTNIEDPPPQSSPALQADIVASHAEEINQVLFTIANAVNTTLNLEELYKSIHQSLGLIIDVTNFFIAIVDSKKRTLYFPYYVDTVDTDFEPITNFTTENSLTGLVVQKKTPLLLNTKKLQKIADKRGVWGPSPLIWMGVPLRVRDEIIGVIAVQSYTDSNIYNENDLQILSAVSHQTAIAIDRKVSLENLKKSELRFRQLFEDSNDAIFIYDIEGKILDCNMRSAELLGYPLRQLSQLSILRLHHPKENKTAKKELNKTVTFGHNRYETTLKRSNGAFIDVEVSARIIDQPGKSIVQGIVRDITDRKIFELNIRQSKERLAFALQATGSGVWDWNITTGHVYFDDNYYLMAGYTPGEYPATYIEWEKRVHKKDLQHSLTVLEKCKSGISNSYRTEFRYRRKSGDWMWILSIGKVFKEDGDGNHIRITGTHTDITERRLAKDRLKKSEQTYRNIFFNAQIGLLRIRYSDGVMLECNDAIARMLGYANREDCLRDFVPALTYADSAVHLQSVSKLKRYGEIRNHETQFRKIDGSLTWFRYSLKYYQVENYLEGVVEDISDFRTAQMEKVHLQKKLMMSKKMEALGLLAGGVAHDLNNILAGVISYPELMLLKLDARHELVGPIKAMMDAGKRAAMVVNDLLSLARSAATLREIHDINSLVKEYMISPECTQFASLYPDIDIQIQLDAAHPNIACSPVHIKKCLMNLVTNSVEATNGIGQIVISTTNQTSNKKDEKASLDFLQQEVVVSVSDQGPGIAREDIEHIFEPFYTKKRLGKSGTGLGLAVVWSTMKDHDGEVLVKSSEKGTCFRLVFPFSDETTTIMSNSFDREKYKANGELVLIVDDQPQLRDIASQMLSSLGYATHSVSSGEEAVEYLKTRSADIVLLDMLMEPGMNGRQTYEEIIKLYPGQRAIIVSGYSETDDINLALKLGVGAFIKKPYSLEHLVIAIKKELEKPL